MFTSQSIYWYLRLWSSSPSPFSVFVGDDSQNCFNISISVMYFILLCLESRIFSLYHSIKASARSNNNTGGPSDQFAYTEIFIFDFSYVFVFIFIFSSRKCITAWCFLESGITKCFYLENDT